MALFPTFARFFDNGRKGSRSPGRGLFPTIAGFLLPTSSGQRRALAGLIAFALDEKLDPAPLLEAWAADERGTQRSRVAKLARCLGRGMTIGEALDRVPGAVRPQDATALSVAAGLGGSATEAIAVFDAPAESSEPVERGIRGALGYLLTLVLVALPITAFMAFKISPMYARIFDDFGMRHSVWMSAARGFANLVSQFWFLPLLAVLVGSVAARVAPRAWQAFVSVLTLGHLGTLRDSRAADCLGSLDVAAGVHAGASSAAAALATATADPALRARLRHSSALPAGVLSPAETALLSAEPPGRRWVTEALARRHRERILDRKWLVSELILPLFVLLMGAFVFLQAMGTMEPLFDLIGGLT